MLPAAERLAEIPGVSLRLARAIIAGTGLDMARFPAADHLVSWAGLARAARQPGPRQRKPANGHGDAYLKMSCAHAANGAATTETFPGERLRRLSRRLGGIKATCAVARSILDIIWHLPAGPAARFTDPGPGWHDEQAGRDRKIRSHLRQLKAPGLDVTVNPAAAYRQTRRRPGPQPKVPGAVKPRPHPVARFSRSVRRSSGAGGPLEGLAGFTRMFRAAPPPPALGNVEG